MHIGSSEDDQAFAVWLRWLAAGMLNSEDQTVTLPMLMLCPAGTVAALIHHVYPGIASPHPASYFQEHCLLAP